MSNKTSPGQVVQSVYSHQQNYDELLLSHQLKLEN